jgi:hypothetical protein
MKRRIFGLESEYGLTCTHEGLPVLAPDILARFLFEEVVPGPKYPASVQTPSLPTTSEWSG